MKRFIRLSGMAAFWLSWPLLYVYLRRAERTRVLLVSGGEVLLIHTWHGTGKWSLPGGGIHKNEEKALAATRELMEETGVALGVDQLRPLGTTTHTEYKLAFTCHYFVAELKQSLAVQPRMPEVLEAVWIPMHTLDKNDLAPDARYALTAYTALVQ